MPPFFEKFQEFKNHTHNTILAEITESVIVWSVSKTSISTYILIQKVLSAYYRQRVVLRGDFGENVIQM